MWKQKIYCGLRRHPLCTALGYFVLYCIAFRLLELWQRPVWIVHCRLDDLVPFVRWAVVPYVLWFGWVPALFLIFLRRAPQAYWRALYGVAGGTAFTLALYVILPTGLQLRRPVYGTDVCSVLLRLIYQSDTPTNVCPSLHVFVTVLLLLILLSHPGIVTTATRIANIWIAAAICASTVLIDQHSLIDVACGLLLALYVYRRLYRRAEEGSRLRTRESLAALFGGQDLR